MPVVRRKRLADGSFGPPEKVMGEETDQEKIQRLESENTSLMLALTDQYEKNLQLERDNTNTMLALTDIYEQMMGGSN
ncbi:hypothetical protein F9U64_01100 [Gracilibacillus oryzae]|uniref:Uncharacterized protein n=1 Tax=Gracilibacillus oryzae TaxID=1672701 RepID=A0A7C8GVL9_9BACI|nr:hypothetical protein [Gracilibacillus oryzae]KAB8139250.1 hypothetical protein F9U64_01100 [Gracilibacillus oryzae]